MFLLLKTKLIKCNKIHKYMCVHVIISKITMSK